MEFRELDRFDSEMAPGVHVFRTPGEWSSCWRPHYGHRSPPALERDEMAIVVALGRRESSGYDVTIDRLVGEGSTLHVFATESLPGDAWMDVFTHPVHAVATRMRPLLEVRLTLTVA